MPGATAAVVLALLALLLAALALAVGLRLGRRLVRLTARGHPAAPQPAAAVAEVEQLRDAVRGLREELAAARGELGAALRHVAVVRYDAFADLGGRLSFSVALLDDGGDGLVLSSICGRSDARTYAKGVTAGVSEHALSPEEQAAIDHALRGGSRGAAPAPAVTRRQPARGRSSRSRPR